MGQMTHGILYGVRAEDGCDPSIWVGDDGDGGILGDYATHCKPRIDAIATKQSRSAWAIRGRFVPDTEWSDADGARFVGFWISRGASEGGMDGAVLMSQKAVREQYTKAYRRARRRWCRFIKFCEGRQFAVSRAQLWLVETEVA